MATLQPAASCVYRYIHTMLRGTQQQSAARLRGKSCVMPQVYVDIASAWLGCGMLFDAVRPKNSIGKLSVPSKEAALHMMSQGFQNGISQFEKKIIPSSPISFHSFGNLKKVCKKFFFHVDAIALAAYAARQSCSVLHSATRHSVDAPYEGPHIQVYNFAPDSKCRPANLVCEKRA